MSADGESIYLLQLGAGRGTLGQATHSAFPSAKVILIERAGVKHKVRRRHTHTQRDGGSYRCTILRIGSFYRLMRRIDGRAKDVISIVIDWTSGK